MKWIYNGEDSWFHRGGERHCKSVNNFTQRMIEKGEIEKKPCETCGNVKGLAHHDDYNKPLDIRWLCRKHHYAWHKVNLAVMVTSVNNPGFRQILIGLILKQKVSAYQLEFA